MAINYTQLPDYKQFVQTFFVDQELLNTQNAGTVSLETANEQNTANASAPTATATSNETSANSVALMGGYSGLG
tara:strand:+ start:154 stop:375 length:222 start_codon:yes stop_codon:yes gene_type:complete